MSEEQPQSTQSTPQNNQPQPAKMQAQGVSSQPPVTNAVKPDKTVSVPKYAVCMAGDATPIEGVIHAVVPPKKRE